MKNNIRYTCDFINTENIKNKLIEVEAANEVEAKEKILKLLTKLNSQIITVRPLTKEEKNAS